MIDKSATAMRRGQEAEALVKHPLLAEAFEAFETEQIAAWRGCQDPIERERIWRMLACVSQARAYLGRLIVNGRMAKTERDHAEGRAGQYQS